MIKVPVSIGEVLDKISILEIKSERIDDHNKLANVRRELEVLVQAAHGFRVPELEAKLKEVNSELWDVEDALRDAEDKQDFGEEFVSLARSVYRLNDFRAELKRQINVVTGSVLIEEKSYRSKA
jgi:hypothetical protein